MCMYLCACHICASAPSVQNRTVSPLELESADFLRLEEGIGSIGTEITGSCEVLKVGARTELRPSAVASVHNC